MWHNTCVPSIPTQLNVECGNTLMLFLFTTLLISTHLSRYPPYRGTHQLSFCVKKWSIPANLINCGNAPVSPNESGNQAVSQRMPKRDSKKRWPKIIWRERASPEGMFAST